MFRLLLALLTVSAGGCATLFTSRTPNLSIRSDTIRATIEDSAGKRFGITPFDSAIAPARRTLRLSADGHEAAEVELGRRIKPVAFLNFINPLAWWIDMRTGAAWRHSPPLVSRSLRTVPELPLDVEAIIAARFAAAAEEAGCEPLVADAWRDIAVHMQGSSTSIQPPIPDSVRTILEEEIARAQPEIQRLCAQMSPLVARLGEIRREFEDTDPPEVPDSIALLFEPVYFEFGKWEITRSEDRERLHKLGQRLSQLPSSLQVLVEGFADPVGTEQINRELGFARASAVIQELKTGDPQMNRYRAVSYGESPDGLVIPKAGGRTLGAELNRRVTFALDYREEP